MLNDRQLPRVRRQPGFEEALDFIQATRLLAHDAKYSGQKLIESDGFSPLLGSAKHDIIY